MSPPRQRTQMMRKRSCCSLSWRTVGCGDVGDDDGETECQSGQRAGAGLGLALVNRFLELHDGWVEIESSNSHGGGTLVRCHLPRRIHDDEPHPEVSRDRKTAYL